MRPDPRLYWASAYGYASEADYAGVRGCGDGPCASYMDDGVPAGQYDYIRERLQAVPLNGMKYFLPLP